MNSDYIFFAILALISGIPMVMLTFSLAWAASPK